MRTIVPSDKAVSKQMWLLPLVTFGVILFAPGLFADAIPPCASGTLASFVGSSCTIDGYTLEDFTFSESSTGDAPLLTSSDITVVPSVVSTGISMQFFGDFNVPSGTAEYIVQYELDPLLPQVSGISIDLGPNDPVTLTGQFCGNGTFSGPYSAGYPTSCTGTDPSGIFPANLQTIGNNSSDSATFPLLATDLDSRLVLDLSGPASTTWFGANVNISTVPEPSSALWLAPAVLGFAWVRRKRLVVNR